MKPKLNVDVDARLIEREIEREISARVLDLPRRGMMPIDEIKNHRLILMSRDGPERVAQETCGSVVALNNLDPR